MIRTLRQFAYCPSSILNSNIEAEVKKNNLDLMSDESKATYKRIKACMSEKFVVKVNQE